MKSIEKELAEELQALEDDGSLRSLRALGNRTGTYIEHDGRRMLNLSSNDYMGYASDEALTSEFYSSLASGHLTSDFGLGSTASRLLSGNHPGYSRLEKELQTLYGRPATVYCSGYHANIGVLPALTSREDLILVDRLSHASILDGLRLTAAKCQRYPHNDIDQLRSILTENRAKYRRVFVVTESIFSMDGDSAELRKLVELKKEFDLALYIDEAHAVGVRGRQGLGICEESGTTDDLDIIVGTFGKALAGMGAYVVSSPVIKQYLVNKSRSLIFTTALPPVITNWNCWILTRMIADTDRREQLRELADHFRAQLSELNVPTRGSSHIIPAIIGENQPTVDLSEKLQNSNFMVFAIRPPTVPANSSRLRFSLSAAMTWDDLTGIFHLLKGEHS